MSAPVEAQLANSGWQSPHHLVGSPHMSSSYSSFLHLVFKRQDKENVTVLQTLFKGALWLSENPFNECITNFSWILVEKKKIRRI